MSVFYSGKDDIQCDIILPIGKHMEGVDGFMEFFADECAMKSKAIGTLFDKQPTA